MLLSVGSQGRMSGMQVILATSLLIGCAAASLALYFYSRRYVGQLQYLPDAVEPRLCFSVLDFWGHRQAGPSLPTDNPTTQIMPPHVQWLRAVCNLVAMPYQTGHVTRGAQHQEPRIIRISMHQGMEALFVHCCMLAVFSIQSWR